MLNDFIIWLGEHLLYVTAVGSAAMISFFKQVKSGRLIVSWSNIILHLSTALFFGWVMGQLAFSLGYIKPDQLALAGALGAYLGDGVIDLLYKIVGIERRKSK